MSRSILSSWKEIALYLGRSVRTVQRWEREIGLPVHRPSGKDLGIVMALPAELDAWVSAMPTGADVTYPTKKPTLYKTAHTV